MNADKKSAGRNQTTVSRSFVHPVARFERDTGSVSPSALSDILEDMVDFVAPCPWVAATGGHGLRAPLRKIKPARALYTHEERQRRDTSPWTLVQAVLAPLQFLAFAVSLVLVLRYLMTGEGYVLATASILVKTAALYAIMITGSIWEKDVFGKWLFARAFFWEDVVSMLVVCLQTVYLFALLWGWGTPRAQMTIAIAAYTAYVINAAQFVLKLRAARLEGASLASPDGKSWGQAA